MVDALGFRGKFAVIAPSTNTSVQPDFDDMRAPGITNHFSRIFIPDDPINYQNIIQINIVHICLSVNTQRIWSIVFDQYRRVCVCEGVSAVPTHDD